MAILDEPIVSGWDWTPPGCRARHLLTLAQIGSIHWLAVYQPVQKEECEKKPVHFDRLCTCCGRPHVRRFGATGYAFVESNILVLWNPDRCPVTN